MAQNTILSCLILLLSVVCAYAAKTTILVKYNSDLSPVAAASLRGFFPVEYTTQKMLIIGDCPDMGGWAVDGRVSSVMDRVDDNTWKYEIERTAPGIVSCKFKVAVGIYLAMEPYSIIGSMSNAAGPYKLKVHHKKDRTAVVYPHFIQLSGRVEAISNVTSPQLGNTRDVFVYLPPSYIENSQKPFPAIVLQDGTDILGSAVMTGSFDAMFLQGQTNEFVAIGVASDLMNREYEYTPSTTSLGAGGGADLYLDFIVDTVLPMVKASYPRVNIDKVTIGGASYGALTACYAAWTRSHKFEAALCMSASWWWDNLSLLTNHFENTTSPVPNAKFALSAGTGEVFLNGVNTIEETERAVEALEDRNVKHKVVYDEAGYHEMEAWFRQAIPLLSYVFKREKLP